MTRLVILPTINIVQGAQLDQYWRWLSAFPGPRTPVPLTGWTGVFTMTDVGGGDVLHTAPLTLGAAGDISLTIPAEVTATLQPARQIGGRAAAEFQIKLTTTNPELTQVWQGGVSIARAQ